jgi:ribosome-binding protein aMBF1 (putative translation factor)
VDFDLPPSANTRDFARTRAGNARIARERRRGGREAQKKAREVTGEQCREARGRLNWARHELAEAADVPLWFIVAFEDGKATPDILAAYEVDLRAALEEPRRGGV